MLGRWIAALCVLCATFAHEASAQANPSVCIESPSSFVLIEREVLQADAPLPSPLRDEELPWCASSDDPRCAPLHDNSVPSSVGVRIAPALDTSASWSEPIASAEHEFIPHAGLLPSAGQFSRLERPPRSVRRSL
jgi:hypothetical protein